MLNCGEFVRVAASALLGLVAAARAWPHAWPLIIAMAAALLVLLLSFIAPVLLEPLFIRFTPLANSELAVILRALATRAGVPVTRVLVADASRRTRKLNAYVSGLGRTRRLVLFDTLLREADRREVELDVAHELGHRRARHVAKATLLGMLGAAVFVAALWALLRLPALCSLARRHGSRRPADSALRPPARVALQPRFLSPWCIALAALGATKRTRSRSSSRRILQPSSRPIAGSLS